ncbi:hypothetical protein PanWU01x14_331140 [Parasponia andersonii]|uniref:Uncharacterized protein n=1 Tax=Parasponia andersonii TaxID=3476 RepID=A0A2P5AHT8_PARAD|nr:hypothetical protein PanWU01x14_331140 [Parasponia andersonii]
MTLWKHDELLMRIEDGWLISYNLRSQKPRSLSDVVGGKASDFLSVYEGDYALLFVKRLVSVEGKQRKKRDIGA